MSAPAEQTNVSMRGGKPAPPKPDVSWANRFAIAVVAVVMVVSLFQIYSRQAAHESGKIVLSLAHWQLEPGITEGFEYMARRYNEERVRNGLPEIEFKQLPIPENGYGQFVTTQLMGGTAPDLIEMGMGLPWETWIRYRAYYMVPVTSEIFKPNPYNKGTDLEHETWKNTYIDGMGVGVAELQEYYDVGLSTFSVRLFYNKRLLQTLSSKLAAEGKIPKPLDAPPEDLREFFKLCDLMRKMEYAPGKPYLPIAGGSYQFGMMNGNIVDPLTTNLLPDVDENMDFNPGNDETLMAMIQKKISFDDPRVYKVMQLSAELASRFPAGYTGLNRDDGVMQFVQERSVFIATGSWDGSTLREQAKMAEHPFDVGISRFPYVHKNDPECGDLAWGRPYENVGMSFPFALTKTCKHPEIALDFLRFITSKKGNEEFNQRIGWIPVIKGAVPATFLNDFKPNLYGVRSGWAASMGNKSTTVLDQTNPLLLLGEDTRGEPYNIDRWRKDMGEKWLPAAVEDFELRDETLRDALPAKETVAALLRARMLMGDEPQSYFRTRYLGACGDPMNAPRGIAYWQKRLREAREKGWIK
jgi:ABC-type glycerol-3-phosphate transport system substrate-binding protein